MAVESGKSGENGRGPRDRIAGAFARVQDVVYVGLGVVIAISAVALLVHGCIDLLAALRSGDVKLVVSLLDRTLLTLMLVELLYTVQVSFGEHVLRPEPFILIGLIAAVRRILVITAEVGGETRPEHLVFAEVMVELALLTVLTIVLVGSLAILHRKVKLDEERAPAAHEAGK